MLADNTQSERTAPAVKKLIIGLDFGAAFTKVVIGDNRVRYAVPFGWFAHPENQYLLPSILNIDNENLCSLTPATNSSCEVDNLKFPLLDKTCTVEDMLRVSAYLALVFRVARGWLLERYKKRYGHAELSWSINAGLPIENTDNSGLSEIYKQAIHSAWAVSVLPGPVTLNRIRQYMGVDDSAFDVFPVIYRSQIIKKELINTFPGCCAQICGYVHSKQCEDDLHMLIDVGAGTISIATFMVDNADDADNRCVLYACAVEPIGVDYLLKRRYENLQLSDKEINLFKDIPDAYSFSQAHDLTEKDIKFADTLYSGEAARLINKILMLTKSKYCPDSKCWESGVLTFTYGGGAHLEIVQNIIDSHERKLPPHKIRSIRLNIPDDLMAENLPVDSYDRLSIAYGLSFEASEIGKASEENEIGEAAADYLQ
ncbi:MAG: hypothetical protein IMF15_03205 [Proteobacteria bacterium]|nr:hypothetical protein [Pseudomonadota bacterium]